MDLNDAQVDAIVHSHRNQQRIGASLVAVEVFGWAIKHAGKVPVDAMRELMDIVAPKEPE